MMQKDALMFEESLPSSPIRVHSDEQAEIAALAYRFYCEEGFPEGKADEHWSRAERQVRGTTSSANSESLRAEAPAATARAENPPLEE
jgi:Protein of unknown function (DUF2934)